MYNFHNMKIVLVSIAPLVLISTAWAQEARTARDILETTCSACHDASRVETEKSRDEWQYTVDRMADKGADINDVDKKVLVNYLTKYFGDSVNVNKASAKEMESELVITADEAEAIVKARSASGDFKAFEDLGKVSGLDVKKLEPIKNRIKFY